MSRASDALSKRRRKNIPRQPRHDRYIVIPVAVQKRARKLVFRQTLKILHLHRRIIVKQQPVRLHLIHQFVNQLGLGFHQPHIRSRPQLRRQPRFLMAIKHQNMLVFRKRLHDRRHHDFAAAGMQIVKPVQQSHNDGS